MTEGCKARGCATIRATAPHRCQMAFLARAIAMLASCSASQVRRSELKADLKRRGRLASDREQQGIIARYAGDVIGGGAVAVMGEENRVNKVTSRRKRASARATPPTSKVIIQRRWLTMRTCAMIGPQMKWLKWKKKIDRP